jgi:hypothetical protein
MELWHPEPILRRLNFKLQRLRCANLHPSLPSNRQLTFVELDPGKRKCPSPLLSNGCTERSLQTSCNLGRYLQSFCIFPPILFQGSFENNNFRYPTFMYACNYLNQSNRTTINKNVKRPCEKPTAQNCVVLTCLSSISLDKDPDRNQLLKTVSY